MKKMLLLVVMCIGVMLLGGYQPAVEITSEIYADATIQPFTTFPVIPCTPPVRPS